MDHPEFGTRAEIIARVYAAAAQPIAPMTDQDRLAMWRYSGTLLTDPEEPTVLIEVVDEELSHG
jgi:hypothetical protein